MFADDKLIEGCLNNDSRAQESLYKQYAPKMFGVCMRFAKNQMEAEDILQEGFIKVYSYLKTFRREGSLEGWIRKTVINTAINLYKKNLKHMRDGDLDEADRMKVEKEDAVDRLSLNELLELIQELPDGYRMVFNLYIIEGFTHKEIGNMLEISENTSKSQLSRARNALQKKISELNQER
ncbi:MAG: sigma-70 family RNA polymerase sigma factor [Bacteroidales bacterium]|nr:sigma-70 family RNA polymerase sigma factor [Bacteroidales bacterium]